MLTQLRPDLWETTPFSPFPGLTTHAFLWRSPAGENVLFYSPGDDSAFADLVALGGVGRQYLSHQDEAGPVLGRIAERFGSALHGPSGDLAAIEKHRKPDVVLATRAVDDLGIEVIPTPGHTPGSTSFLVPGADGARYLFPGDTLYQGADGRWTAGYVAGMSDAQPLHESLALLAELRPDVVASSAFAGGGGIEAVDPSAWRGIVEHAQARLTASVG